MSINQTWSAITFLLFTYSLWRNRNHIKEQRILANKNVELLLKMKLIIWVMKSHFYVLSSSSLAYFFNILMRENSPRPVPIFLLYLCLFFVLYLYLKKKKFFTQYTRKQAQMNIFSQFFIKILIIPFQNILHFFLLKKHILVADRGCPLPRLLT